jgi:peptidoglycan/xylan/chitin deacetylase (PgdA/CDA1 family)
MTIALAVTLDVDQDGIAYGSERDTLTWKAVELIPRIAELLEARGIRATWFVRADNQLAELYGTAAYLLETHARLWASLRAAGHALAWHPHVYRRDGDTWLPETDGIRCADRLREIASELRAGGHWFQAVRIGEAFHSNETMQALDELGLKVDSTAIPGRRRDDGVRSFDWEPTANTPYHPSRADYRVPGEDALAILEVPMTTVPIQAPYDQAPLRRYVNLAFRHDLLSTAVEGELDGLPLIVTLTHPEEAFSNPPNPLFGGGLENIAANLDMLLERARSRGDVRIVTMNELA